MHYDAVILGAGAAGLFCALNAARRGRRVLIADHARAPGEKIRISGGGRCNFTNLHASPENFLSANPRFAVSALARYTQYDFLEMVEAEGIAWHEKTLGQLFCDGRSTQIVDMLVRGATEAGAELALSAPVREIAGDGPFDIRFEDRSVTSDALVIATGGKSIPKMGATGFGYDVARQYGVPVTEIRPALVPLTFTDAEKAWIGALSGLSVDAQVSCNDTQFREGMLFTHRGLSGPSILQISSYWREGEEIAVDLMPGEDAFARLRDLRQSAGRQSVRGALAQVLPRRLGEQLGEGYGGNLADMSDAALRPLAEQLSNWRLRPAGSEGYRTAEVTLGGVDTDALDSRTMAVKAVPGLYFIGEVVDVTGWLGGYNFQWAWSSGWAAAQAI
ncbi:NAD(P)/FAD-dependent oxidoreductase [Pontivivens ytuae]|uniref:NAD(P)/FAD-dependent oxidoreductase n=1 Tax=Pontivivens ytuae TaxID=2789856 RepID=UPI001E5588CE|nr:NAD(P)/FAD-dependent oxidoreductase [Pontivivens ytuae]